MANNCSKEPRTCINCGKTYIPNSNRQKYCIDCKSFQKSLYWRTHKEKKKELDRIRYQNKREHILNNHKIWASKNREHLREYESNYRRKRKQKDEKFKLLLWCRSAINRCLNLKKEQSTFDILGYTPEQLKQRLEMNFKPDMNWENHGTLWHIDHIKPLCKFNFIDENREVDYHQIFLANCLANLQPLYVEENLSKGGK